MDAKETIKYLYENGHIMSREHYKTIYDELTALSIQSKSRFNDWLLAKAEIKHLKLECGFLHNPILKPTSKPWEDK